ncbi:dual specificity phosphatase [Verticillium dahliae VdLs.17]|uniref:phosphatidylinositol-3,4,5-trisphosphate 3-phosphatase n=1 Tax=Verticillium dahliae (strain VdLs.17 / ATCC MYA-4575 / FGSC 10137) TaxID=498257 RepID=G2XCS0_VERDV|nr:dual specificity phosphatase [Verticillium dahliae VdLs.17]EGY16788.1 dual specificity phosphatase [Verticillium dahliae VdLs.17]
MASILRQIVAGPRSQHPEAGIDLCYVTSDIIATHYPWPDHHPPPFRLVPMIMASMRNWLHGGDLHDGNPAPVTVDAATAAEPPAAATQPARDATQTNTTQPDAPVTDKDKKKRVAVVHCKAGKGRSGTISCSYLIAECGWRPEEALTRFTERRMRPKFGAGVSIPSQLRTVSYVDRWARHGKKYVDCPIEIVEIHVWGLRSGVKVDIEGFADAGRRIQIFHTFSKKERIIIDGNAPETDGGGVAHMMYDLAGVPAARTVEGAPEEAEYAESTNLEDPNGDKARNSRAAGSGGAASPPDEAPSRSSSKKRLGGSTKTLLHNAKTKTKTGLGYHGTTDSPASSNSHLSGYSEDASTENEPGGMAVILKPTEPVQIANSDVNISVERRSRSSSSLGLTMVTAVAHVWFNAFFEGNGPEQDGKPDTSGVFSIDWEAMDGIKGSSRKGSRALDRIAVVWRLAGATDVPGQDQTDNIPGEIVVEPPEGSAVPQMEPADWKGQQPRRSGAGQASRVAGRRNPASADVSKASSVKSQEIRDGQAANGDETNPLAGVRISGPAGEEELNGVKGAPAAEVSSPVMPQGKEPGPELLDNPDTASRTTGSSGAQASK